MGYENFFFKALDNVKRDLAIESLLERIGSHARIITFSPPRMRSKPPSLEAFYYFPGILTDCNSLPPASLSLVLLQFNCDFHGYLTRSRSTCIKCSSGINLLLVLKPRLFGQGCPTDIPFTVSVTALPPLTLNIN